MPENISLELNNAEARLIFDRPESTANIFDHQTMEELNQHLETLEKENNLQRLLITSAKKSIFIAGADINLIKNLENQEQARQAVQNGQQVFERLSRLRATTVACIHGACMGGGFELTLACDYRVATTSSKTKLALPEVQLGILPAWGGTTRVPQLIDFDKALDLLLTGRVLDGKKALKLGLIDACCPEEVLLDVARSLKSKKKKSSFKSRLMTWGIIKNFILKQARKGVMQKTRGLYPAPLKILDILQQNPSYNHSLQLEVEAFSQLAVTSECRSLVNLFLTKEAADKDSSWLDKSGKKLPPTENMAVLGAGVMGGGIAHLAAKKNFKIRMRDINNQGLAAGMQAAQKLVNTEVKRRKISAWEGRKRLAHIMPVLDLKGFHEVDTVIEAVVENIDIKKKVLAELESVVSKNALMASNTSSLSITELATALKKPENFVGIHFFNPVHRMPLIEIVRGKKTSDFTVARAVALTQALGKTPVVVNDGPGFLVNRLLAPYMNEALRLIEEGIHPEHIDKALLDYGMPMGPIRLTDEVGIDVALKVSHILTEGLGPRMTGPQFIEELVEQKNLGKKTGQGFYNYTDKKPEVVSRFTSLAHRGSAQDIQLRVLLPMWNEACRCLDEKIVEDAQKLDLAMILGTGYAPFRGGPMRSAEAMGWKTVEQELHRHSEKYGERFTPCEYLKKLI